MSIRFPHQRHWLLIAVLTTCSVRAAWAVLVSPDPIADFAFYYTRAKGMVEGQGYEYLGHPTAFFPVGTSLILAFFFLFAGPSLAIAKVASVISWMVTTWLVYMIGNRINGPKLALTSCLIVALYPDFIVVSGLVASENFFIPFVLGAMYCMAVATEGNPRRRRWFLGAGLLLGGAILVRSTAVILVPVVLAMLAWRFRRIDRCSTGSVLLFLAGVGLAVTPWIARNAVVMGSPLLTTNGGISLWSGNNPGASGGGFDLGVPRPALRMGTIAGEIEDNRRLSAEAYRFILENPAQWLSLIPRKLLYLFRSPAPDLGFWTRHKYVGGPSAIDYHPNLGTNDAQFNELANYAPRPLGWVEGKAVGLYYLIAGGSLIPYGTRGAVIQAVFWVLGSVGLGALAAKRGAHILHWYLFPPLGWVLFHVTLGNGQPRYLLSISPFLCVGIAYLILIWMSSDNEAATCVEVQSLANDVEDNS